MTTRRNFLRNTSLAALATALPTTALATQTVIEPEDFVGLYSKEDQFRIIYGSMKNKTGSYALAQVFAEPIDYCFSYQSLPRKVLHIVEDNSRKGKDFGIKIIFDNLENLDSYNMDFFDQAQLKCKDHLLNEENKLFINQLINTKGITVLDRFDLIYDILGNNYLQFFANMPEEYRDCYCGLKAFVNPNTVEQLLTYPFFNPSSPRERLMRGFAGTIEHPHSFMKIELQFFTANDLPENEIYITDTNSHHNYKFGKRIADDLDSIGKFCIINKISGAPLESKHPDFYMDGFFVYQTIEMKIDKPDRITKLLL